MGAWVVGLTISYCTFLGGLKRKKGHKLWSNDLCGPNIGSGTLLQATPDPNSRSTEVAELRLKNWAKGVCSCRADVGVMNTIKNMKIQLMEKMDLVLDPGIRIDPSSDPACDSQA